MKRLFLIKKSSGVPKAIGKAMIVVFAFGVGIFPLSTEARVRSLPKMQQNWEHRVNDASTPPKSVKPPSCEEQAMFSSIPSLATCKIKYEIGGKKCYHNCTCPQGYVFVNGKCETNCASSYQFDCSGTGYQRGEGTPCKGKYLSCVCDVGFYWDGYRCDMCSSAYSKTDAICKSEHSGFANWMADNAQMCSNKSKSCSCAPNANCPAATWNQTTDMSCLYGSENCNDGCQMRYKCKACVGNPPAGYSSTSPVCEVNQTVLIADDGCGKDYFKCVCALGFINEENYWNGL